MSIPPAHSVQEKTSGDRAGHSRVLAILSLLMAFSSMSIDLYLPAMPGMAVSLGGDAAIMPLTIASYLAGLTMGQLAWGPVGDAIGRKRPLLCGLTVFVVGSIGCALADSIAELIGWRLVQGIGASAGVVLARAIVRDLYSGDEAARMLSTLIAIMALSPLIGPVIGAKLLHIVAWPFIFWLLAVIGALTIGAVWTLPETWTPQAVSSSSRQSAATRYLSLAHDARIWTYAGAGAFYYFGMFAFIGASPVVFINGFGLSPDLFAWLLAGGTTAIIATNLANGRLIARFGYPTVLRAGTAVALVAAACSLALAIAQDQRLASLIITIIVFMGMAGLIVGNSIAGALDARPAQAGSVSAFVGSLQYAGGMAGSAFVAAIADGTARPMTFAMLVSGAGAFALAVRTKAAAKS